MSWRTCYQRQQDTQCADTCSIVIQRRRQQRERDGARLVDATWDYCFNFLLSDLLSARITLTVLQPTEGYDRSPSTMRKGFRKLLGATESDDHVVVGETTFELRISCRDRSYVQVCSPR